MSNIAIPIGDVNEKLSIAYAMEQGYRIILDSDGQAQVVSPAGEVYRIHNFECECPDKQRRGGSHQGHCKHEIWLSQLRPCEICGSIMKLVGFRTCFGETGQRFECPTCFCAWDIGIVRAERRMHRATGEVRYKLTAEGRCKQAIYWMQAHNRDYFVWKLVEQSPHLAPLLVRELSSASEGNLANQVAKRYGLPAEAFLSAVALAKVEAKAGLTGVPKTAFPTPHIPPDTGNGRLKHTLPIGASA